jgi:uncharacterized protein YkwD
VATRTSTLTRVSATGIFRAPGAPTPFYNFPSMPEPHDDPYYRTRQKTVEQINRDRAAAGLSPVALDLQSSLISDHHCQEMAAHRYLSHWDLRGLLPYHRYHFDGGRDHVQESLSATSIISNEPAPIPTDPEGILPNLLQSHKRFMNEKPPLDGHRKNVLDPAHTHVGIGLAVVGGEFRMGEEFINRYVLLKEMPAALPASGSVPVQGEMLKKGYGPYYCVVFYEGIPQPRTVAQLNRTYAYSDMEGEQCANVRPWEMRFNSSNGQFTFVAHIEDRGPGLYHLLLWVRNDVRSIPYELHVGSNAVDTKGAVVTAGWIFKK